MKTTNTSPAKINNAYLQFFMYASQIHFGLDETARVLLAYVGMRHEQGQPLNVTQTMELSFIASPATMHRKLNDLLMFDYISLEYPEGNRRTKHLVPTKKGMTYFDAMATAVKQGVLL